MDQPILQAETIWIWWKSRGVVLKLEVPRIDHQSDHRQNNDDRKYYCNYPGQNSVKEFHILAFFIYTNVYRSLMTDFFQITEQNIIQNHTVGHPFNRGPIIR